jgi:hypothetical protein
MRLIDQLKADLESYRGVPKCQSVETRREDVTPSKPLICIVCDDPVTAYQVRTAEDSYTHQTEYYCPDCFSVIMSVRKQED